MLKVVNGSLLDFEKGVLIHQINCKGVMNAGVARQIRSKYPQHYQDYLKAYNLDKLRLGKCLVTKINKKLAIIGFCSQDNYGRGKRQTDYIAFKECLLKIQMLYNANQNVKYYMPYGIGCGLAGGDWNIISQLIEDYCPFITLVKYGQ